MYVVAVVSNMLSKKSNHFQSAKNIVILQKLPFSTWNQQGWKKFAISVNLYGKNFCTTTTFGIDYKNGYVLESLFAWKCIFKVFPL